MIGEQKTTSALVVIDLQNAIVDSPLHDAERVLGTVAGLLDAAREQGVPVVFVRHQDPDEDEMRAGSDGWQIHPAVAPREGEVIVEKQWGDAFAATDMRQQLAKLGVRHLYLTGAETDACIRATHVGALAHGYDVTLVTDAHSLWGERPGMTLNAAQIIAYHNEVAPFLAYPGARTQVASAAEVSFTGAPETAGV
jgi:nicotinamidase-related amidase